jgi:two-component system response regulator HydG
MWEMQRMIKRVAVNEAPVLVLGESGVGKELVARNIHAIGPRNARRLIAINCATLPDALLESELFGHVKGSFTGATRSRRGLFQEADGGTLFLDEIAEMSAVLQAKLLRVLEDGEVRAVGADVTHHVDVRIIAATNRDLAQRVAERRFREDLFFRLNVLPVQVPALRERGGDIRLLALFFLAKERAVTPGVVAQRFTAEALSMLKAHSWPGNVRELDNVVRRLVLLSDAEEIGVREISACGLQIFDGESPGDASIAVAENDVAPDPGADEAYSTDRVLEVCEPAFSQLGSLPPPLSAVEDAYISWVVARYEGNKTRAARHLGVDVSTLHRRERRQRRMKEE